MTTERRRLANRENAKKSTGPRSAAGKARASRNAMRHGLSTMAVALEGYEDRIAQIANKLCEKDPFPYRYKIAVQIAEAQVFLDRLRLSRAAAIENRTKPPPPPTPIRAPREQFRATFGIGLTDELLQAMAENKVPSVIRILKAQTRRFKSLVEMLLRGERPVIPNSVEAPSRESTLAEACAELAMLERYEQRAIARKRRLFRKFLALQD